MLDIFSGYGSLVSVVSALREMGSPSWLGLAEGPWSFSAAIWRMGLLMLEGDMITVL